MQKKPCIWGNTRIYIKNLKNPGMTNSQQRAEVTSRAWLGEMGGWGQDLCCLPTQSSGQVLTGLFFAFWWDRFHNKNGKIKTHSFKINSFVNICQISLLKSCSQLRDQRAWGQGTTFCSTAALVRRLTLLPRTEPISQVLISPSKNAQHPHPRPLSAMKRHVWEGCSPVKKRNCPAAE